MLFLFLRLPGLGRDIANSDSIRWHRRSEKFLSALKQRDLSSTYQHYQPGVSLMWINSIVKQAAFSYQLATISSSDNAPKTLENAGLVSSNSWSIKSCVSLSAFHGTDLSDVGNFQAVWRQDFYSLWIYSCG